MSPFRSLRHPLPPLAVCITQSFESDTVAQLMAATNATITGSGFFVINPPKTAQQLANWLNTKDDVCQLDANTVDVCSGTRFFAIEYGPVVVASEAQAQASAEQQVVAMPATAPLNDDIIQT